MSDLCVAVFDLCARLQAVVQEVWELYFSGLAACVGWSCRRGPMPLRPRTGENTLEVGRGAGSKGFNRVSRWDLAVTSQGALVQYIRNIIYATESDWMIPQSVLGYGRQPAC